MKNKTILLILGAVVFVYLFSYVWIRRSNTRIIEVDGCPTEGCTVVRFPEGVFYLIYSPLILLDRGVTHAEIIFNN